MVGQKYLSSIAVELSLEICLDWKGKKFLWNMAKKETKCTIDGHKWIIINYKCKDNVSTAFCKPDTN
jgi:hypothetical protein